ncbi:MULTISPECIES: nitroreductase family protein [unclassified Candidatus Frackibacter]|uniref:nitroreductase family protein n=1 Tax=unclassified Candidatus Frackibacter TaxID=2648818 RepID=UPI000795D0B3|nr:MULTISPECIES: nitroreductase family protein [unclassified Candidatus Frackibacter]KXS43734.1 MAG: nitroreductase [Candidatus Frackibacter sp. T328-2]SDC20544.1 Nitroreductase [Candidatus Frackibacter sp. WG11]SEM51152.1 Nitroreductase [Candidatus Frackibacter sp. WG12]SFL52419.1 Nitroreductase [Candidatus Frackibacter sp. WG13]
MNILDVIKNRRSVRRYRDKSVSNELIEKIIDAARFAPSAHNDQPWKFIVTKDEEKLEQMSEDSKYAKFLSSAPAAIVVCADYKNSHQREGIYDYSIDYFCIQDTAAAIQNILLAAQGLGLGTCWIGDYDEEKLSNLFNIEDPYYPVGIISLGFTDKLPGTPKRKPLEEILCYEKFEE